MSPKNTTTARVAPREADPTKRATTFDPVDLDELGVSVSPKNTTTARVAPREADPTKRATTFDPVDLGYTDDDALLEAGRCLQCKKAPCVAGCPVGVDIPHFVRLVHEGDWRQALDVIRDALLEAGRCLQCKKAPCVAGCPVGVDIPHFVRLVHEGDWRQALDVIRGDNLLPSICGRVCPQETQCEGRCVLGRKGEPLAIGQLERFVGDKAAEIEGLAAEEGAVATEASPHRVAVVGSGPAGITCALELRRAGVEVTLFESLHRLGGVLTYGIPVFRLPDDVVARELAALADLGVSIERNTVVGRTVTVPELLEERGFDAVFLGVGAGLPKLVGVPGENLVGVFCANEYLTRVNLMGAYDFPTMDTPVRRGRNVVVLGGGNVAMDAARTALRLGAESVTLAYRRTEAEMPARRAEVEHAKEEGVRILELAAPLDFTALRLGAESVTLAYRRTEAEMPARRAEVEHAKEEGVRILELAAPLDFVGDERGSVVTARFRRMRLGEPGPDGRRSPVPLEGDDAVIELPCDTAITAIGTNASPLVPLMAPGLALNARGYIEVDEQGRTSDPRVWAGGDIVTGAATVILAMGAGKAAAADIVRALER